MYQQQMCAGETEMLSTPTVKDVKAKKTRRE